MKISKTMSEKQDDNKLVNIEIPQWYVYFILDILNNAEYDEREKHGKWEQGEISHQYQYSDTKKSKQILWILNFIRRQINQVKQILAQNPSMSKSEAAKNF